MIDNREKHGNGGAAQGTPFRTARDCDGEKDGELSLSPESQALCSTDYVEIAAVSRLSSQIALAEAQFADRLAVLSV